MENLGWDEWKWDVQQCRWKPKTYNMRVNEPLRKSGRHGFRGGQHQDFFAKKFAKGGWGRREI